MKVVVTGGAGFIGSHIVDKLVARGAHTVVVDDLSTGVREHVNPAAEFVKLDVCSSELRELFAAHKFDYVLHLAAQTMVPASLQAPDFDARINIQGTINVLEACRSTGVKRIVSASSAAVYGNVARIPVLETAPTAPTSFYGLSKLTVEHYLALYSTLFGLEYAALRFANVYGERQGDGGEGGVVSIFTRLIHADKPLHIFGDGGQTRDFIYAGDVAEANIAALTAPCVNQPFNISTKTETSVNQLVDTLAQITGRDAQKVYQPARAGDIYRSSLDNSRAVACFDWKPAIGLVEGLSRTYRSLV